MKLRGIAGANFTVVFSAGTIGGPGTRTKNEVLQIPAMQAAIRGARCDFTLIRIRISMVLSLHAVVPLFYSKHTFASVHSDFQVFERVY